VLSLGNFPIWPSLPVEWLVCRCNFGSVQGSSYISTSDSCWVTPPVSHLNVRPKRAIRV